MKKFAFLLFLILFLSLLSASMSAQVWDGPIPSDKKEREAYYKQAAANFTGYKYAGIINVTETAGKDRSLELVVARSSRIDIGAIDIKTITGPSSSAHGGVSYVKDVRIAQWDGSHWNEIPSQTGNVVFYPDLTATFDVYFLANVTANSMKTYYIFYGAEDPDAIEDPMALYGTDLKYKETVTGGVNVWNTYYNMTVDASIGGWITGFSVIDGSGTTYPHGDSGGGVGFFSQDFGDMHQIWNTLEGMIHYEIQALGPIVVQVKYWGPVVDGAHEDPERADYETTWTFSACSPRIVLYQNVSLKTLLTLNDFRLAQWQIPLFNWYDFYVLQSDRSLYAGAVTKAVDHGGAGVDFNNAYWEVDVTRNHPTDAVAVIPEEPVFDIVKEHWYNIACMDYVLDTRNPDTKTQEFGARTYASHFYIYIQNAETLTASDCAKVKEYEVLSKQPLRASAEIPGVAPEEVMFIFCHFNVSDLSGVPLPGVTLRTDKGETGTTDQYGVSSFNVTKGQRNVTVYWQDIPVAIHFFTAARIGQTEIINASVIEMGLIGLTGVRLGTNATISGFPSWNDSAKLLSLNLTGIPESIVVIKIIGRGVPPSSVTVNDIPGYEPYDYVYKIEDDVLTVYCVIGSNGFSSVKISYGAKPFPWLQYIIIFGVAIAAIVAISVGVVYARRKKKG